MHRLALIAQEERLAQRVDYKMLLAQEHALLVNTLPLDHHLALIALLA